VNSQYSKSNVYIFGQIYFKNLRDAKTLTVMHRDKVKMFTVKVRVCIEGYVGYGSGTPNEYLSEKPHRPHLAHMYKLKNGSIKDSVCISSKWLKKLLQTSV